MCLLPGSPRPVPTDGHIEPPPAVATAGEDEAILVAAAALQLGVAGPQQVGQAGLGPPASVSASTSRIKSVIVKKSQSHKLRLRSDLQGAENEPENGRNAQGFINFMAPTGPRIGHFEANV